MYMGTTRTNTNLSATLHYFTFANKEEKENYQICIVQTCQFLGADFIIYIFTVKSYRLFHST